MRNKQRLDDYSSINLRAIIESKIPNKRTKAFLSKRRTTADNRGIKSEGRWKGGETRGKISLWDRWEIKVICNRILGRQTVSTVSNAYHYYVFPPWAQCRWALSGERWASSAGSDVMSLANFEIGSASSPTSPSPRLTFYFSSIVAHIVIVKLVKHSTLRAFIPTPGTLLGT